MAFWNSARLTASFAGLLLFAGAAAEAADPPKPAPPPPAPPPVARPVVAPPKVEPPLPGEERYGPPREKPPIKFVEVKPVFAAPPRLATTPAELAADKQAADFPARRAAAIKEGDRLVSTPVPLPEGYGSWTFYYACPDDGATLQMVSLTDHVCPKCKKHYSDERTVAAYRCQMHYALEHAALALGWAYAYSGDDKYVREVKRILLKLAGDYAGYPVRLDRWGHKGMFAPLGGRRYVQSLDEAVGAVKLAKAYDLTRTSAAWSDDERRHVEKDFFLPTGQTLCAFSQGRINHQTWYNAGLMCIASVLGDAELVNLVLNKPGGYYFQLHESLGDDGFWFEGTMSYQQYALTAMIEIVDAARRMGVVLDQEPRFKALIASPLKATYPDGQFACINDSDPTDIRLFSSFYEWAWKTYHDPVYAQAAAWGDEKKLASLLGPGAKPASPLETRSIDCPDVGIAVLRAGQGADAACVFLHYGIHATGDGGHSHYDKLGITLYANRREWLVDIGRIGYTHKEYKGYAKRTVAHNTVELEGADQAANTGRLLWFKTGDKFTACAAESTRSYRDVTLRRYLLLTPKMLIDVFDVAAPQPAKIDCLAHAVVPAIKPVDDRGPPAPAALGNANGYEYLTGCQRWPTPGASRWDFLGSSETAPRLRAWFAASPGEEVYTATGIGHSVEEKAPCVVRRRQAQKTRFATVYDLSGKGDYVTQVESLDGELPALKIDMGGRTHEIRFLADGVKTD